ncbi:MAG TPA: hypothetical protein VFP34_00185 [Microlunatus sp.]|nr:hypothetical protein [Microlunatus sp.]
MVPYDEAVEYAYSLADEHREWHRLNGPPESTVCPWDCYDPPEPERCEVCAEYLHGECSNADKDWHRAIALNLSSERLVRSAAREKERFERSKEPDPWF